jgi:hypothetical protein
MVGTTVTLIRYFNKHYSGGKAMFLCATAVKHLDRYRLLLSRTVFHLGDTCRMTEHIS